MSISLSSAKKKVEIQIAREGSKTIQEKIQVAKNVLKICEKNDGVLQEYLISLWKLLMVKIIF